MKRFLISLFALAIAQNIFGADSLFYFEAQGLAAYSSAENGAVYRSAGIDDVMQKNSIGFDLIKKFSGNSGDVGSAAFQFRLVYDADKNEVEPQLFNAYLKGKTPLGDIWLGHDRIAFGLASYWDTHGDLLQPLPMYGFGFDRDWGAGFSRDFAKGDLKLAFTTGTGMGFAIDKNFLASARGSYGVLSYDNYNIGLSFMGGKIPDTMGYEIMDMRKTILTGGIDIAFNYNNIEQKFEINYGRKNDEPAFAVFYRIGFNFFDENRLKLEAQYTYTDKEGVEAHTPSGGVTFRVTQDITLRTIYEWNSEADDHRFAAQIYLYFAL
ncbi:MAG: hypothetical protein LBV52_06835 [Spirochaetaceae bacterium]|jgi:hypothetical protein|nr:hypothetical protein [Spirochaetaceae bacterium]